VVKVLCPFRERPLSAANRRGRLPGMTVLRRHAGPAALLLSLLAIVLSFTGLADAARKAVTGGRVVRDNGDHGGFAGARPVSDPERFRCAFGRTQGTPAANMQQTG
jgi:hypothetical protein